MDLSQECQRETNSTNSDEHLYVPIHFNNVNCSWEAVRVVPAVLHNHLCSLSIQLAVRCTNPDMTIFHEWSAVGRIVVVNCNLRKKLLKYGIKASIFPEAV